MFFDTAAPMSTDEMRALCTMAVSEMDLRQNTPQHIPKYTLFWTVIAEPRSYQRELDVLQQHFSPKQWDSWLMTAASAS